jgi:hypothetical protein
MENLREGDCMNWDKIFEWHFQMNFKRRMKPEIFKEPPKFHAEKIHHRADLSSLKFYYDKQGVLHLADARPSGHLYKGEG